MVNKLNFDNLSSPMRFHSGMNVSFVETTDATLHNEKSYYLTNLVCCSPVKQTRNNWFYPITDAVSMDRLKPWIADIAPMFPSLDIKIFNSSAVINKLKTGSTGNKYFNLNHYGVSKPISIVLNLSERSNSYYSSTRLDNHKCLYFDSLDFLFNRLFGYCISNKLLFAGDSYVEIITEFVDKNIGSIKEDFENPYPCYVSLTPGGLRYDVVTNYIVDIDSVTKENILQYILAIIRNYNNLSDSITVLKNILGSTSDKKEEGAPYIQALYSKKSYKVEAYLAHHLIRAGISNDFIPFIDQYFKIKKELPGEYFWNLIFLTQFGFKFYYYYWLTDRRLFRMTTRGEFEKWTKEYTDHSSLAFLEKFVVKMNTGLYSSIKGLYIKGDLKNIIKSLGKVITVVVKPEKRGKLPNLQIAPAYVVTSVNDNYYFIRGDDFRVHRYLKSHFNLISE